MNGHRWVTGLISAQVCDRPKHIPKGRPRGKKAAGLRYERELAKGVPAGKHGQWFQFEDRGGRGYCQTDVVLEVRGALVVLEAKYTWTPQGHSQLEKLYIPVVRTAMKRQAYGIVVCKVLTVDTPVDWLCRTLDEAIDRALLGLPTVLHWIGAGLGPLQLSRKTTHLASDHPIP